ncbi:cytochrome P450 [Streptomyces flaveolus]|uniref:cytochrome P450 n=1 Tax=Streptomyces flaveolus TaxID=67297 RepID=UPI00381EA2CA
MTVTDAGALADRLFRLEPDALADPFPAYAALRADLPVHRWGPMVVVARYADVKQALRDTETLSSVRADGSRVARVREGITPERNRKFDAVLANENLWLVQLDDPEHARLQRFVKATFSRPRIRQMRDRIQKLCDELLDAAEASNPGRLELISDFAYKLPLLVICDLLGAEIEDAAKIREWSDHIAVAIGTSYSNIDDAYEAVTSFQKYVSVLIERSRGSETATDLFAQLVSTDAGGEFLTDDELVSMFTLLLFAGHETTTNLIANGINELLRHPEQRALVAEDPGKLDNMVSELLRYCTSVHAVHRVARRDCEIGGFPVKKGETVRLLLASANRDESAFENPDTFDVTRKDARQHLGMGYGIHTCLGIWLARLETELAIGTLLRRYPGLALDGEVEWARNFTLHGPKVMNLTY